MPLLLIISTPLSSFSYFSPFLHYSLIPIPLSHYSSMLIPLCIIHLFQSLFALFHYSDSSLFIHYSSPSFVIPISLSLSIIPLPLSLFHYSNSSLSIHYSTPSLFIHYSTPSFVIPLFQSPSFHPLFHSLFLLSLTAAPSARSSKSQRSQLARWWRRSQGAVERPSSVSGFLDVVEGCLETEVPASRTSWTFRTLLKVIAPGERQEEG